MDAGVEIEIPVGDVGIITHDMQLGQALRADNLILAVDEHLGAEVHLLAALGTDVLHNMNRMCYKR